MKRSLKETRAAYYKANKPKLTADIAAWKIQNKEKVRGYRRKAAGLPEPARSRPDNCECCGVHKSINGKELAYDHCHNTNEFRGWLCTKCNTGIGLLGDSVDGLNVAIAYLNRTTNAKVL